MARKFLESVSASGRDSRFIQWSRQTNHHPQRKDINHVCYHDVDDPCTTSRWNNERPSETSGCSPGHGVARRAARAFRLGPGRPGVHRHSVFVVAGQPLMAFRPRRHQLQGRGSRKQLLGAARQRQLQHHGGFHLQPEGKHRLRFRRGRHQRLRLHLREPGMGHHSRRRRKFDPGVAHGLQHHGDGVVRRVRHFPFRGPIAGQASGTFSFAGEAGIDPTVESIQGTFSGVEVGNGSSTSTAAAAIAAAPTAGERYGNLVTPANGGVIAGVGINPYGSTLGEIPSATTADAIAALTDPTPNAPGDTLKVPARLDQRARRPAASTRHTVDRRPRRGLPARATAELHRPRPGAPIFGTPSRL